MYRTQIIGAISDTLAGTGVTHIQLWNQDIQFLNEGQPFPTPAVFIEFMPVQWQTNKEGVIYTNDAQISIHCVTHVTQEDLRFRIASLLRKAVTSIKGQNFSRLIPFQDDTNHNHAELIEDIYTFRLRIWL